MIFDLEFLDSLLDSHSVEEICEEFSIELNRVLADRQTLERKKKDDAQFIKMYKDYLRSWHSELLDWAEENLTPEYLDKQFIKFRKPEEKVTGESALSKFLKENGLT